MAGPLPEQHAQILAQKLADGQLALFVGAGLSRQAVARDGSGRKLPLWKELAEQVATACHEDLGTYGGNILDLFDAIAFGQSRFELDEAVRRVLDDSDFDPSEAHHALAEVPWAGVYTTNYDGLLRRVLNETPVVEEDQYDRDSDGYVRRMSVQALAAAVRVPEVREAVLARISDNDAYVRATAVGALADATEMEVRAALAGRLEDEDWIVRLIATLVLSANGEPTIQRAILARLCDPDDLVRMTAAKVLARSADEAEVRSALLVRLADDEGAVRGAAVRALAAAVGEAEVRSALLVRLADDEGPVRGAAARALAGAVAEAEVRAALLALLADDKWYVRRAAAKALAAWIVAEKFGLPAADVVPVYP